MYKHHPLCTHIAHPILQEGSSSSPRLTYSLPSLLCFKSSEGVLYVLHVKTNLDSLFGVSHSSCSADNVFTLGPKVCINLRKTASLDSEDEINQAHRLKNFMWKTCAENSRVVCLLHQQAAHSVIFTIWPSSYPLSAPHSANLPSNKRS